MDSIKVFKILEEDTSLFKLLIDYNSKTSYFREMFIEIIKNNIEIKNNEAISSLLMEIYKARMQHNEVLEIIKKKYNLNGTFNYNFDLDAMTFKIEYL